MHKLKSIKFWALAWCCFMITWIVVNDCQEFVSIATILSAAPMAYMGGNVWQKHIESKGGRNADNN